MKKQIGYDEVLENVKDSEYLTKAVKFLKEKNQVLFGRNETVLDPNYKENKRIFYKTTAKIGGKNLTEREFLAWMAMSAYDEMKYAEDEDFLYEGYTNADDEIDYENFKYYFVNTYDDLVDEHTNFKITKKVDYDEILKELEDEIKKIDSLEEIKEYIESEVFLLDYMYDEKGGLKYKYFDEVQEKYIYLIVRIGNIEILKD